MLIRMVSTFLTLRLAALSEADRKALDTWLKKMPDRIRQAPQK